MMEKLIFILGSLRIELHEFLDLLKGHEIARSVDEGRFPARRFEPFKAEGSERLIQDGCHDMCPGDTLGGDMHFCSHADP